jgi:LacI family transcriptional regulator
MKNVMPRLDNAPRLKLGVLIHEDHLKSRMRIFEGVLDYCLEQENLRAFLVPLRDRKAPDPKLIAEVNGLVTFAAPTDTWLKGCWDSRVPLVNCNSNFFSKLPSISAGEPDELAYYFIRSLGRKTMGYVTTIDDPTGCPIEMTRFQTSSFQDGLDWRVFSGVRKDPARYPEHLLLGSDEAPLEKFLKDLPKPAALWCVHDEMAALVWRKCLDLGFHVPGQIALLGSGDHPCALHSTPGLTTVRMPEARLGYEAAQLVHQHLLGKKALTTECIPQPEPGAIIIERNSTGGTCIISRCVYRAWRLLEEYPDEGLTVEHLIEESKVSRISFYKHFEKAFGMSPGKAIRIARTRKAKQLLQATDMPISQIGRLCGFAGESEFSNFFRRETSQTPKQWRRNAIDSWTGEGTRGKKNRLIA